MIGGTTISGFVITYNEEAAIRECLESMKWADELVVVDSFSQDATVEIAREYTDKVIQREFAGYVPQTRFAFEQTTCDWVLWLDADERLSDRAIAEIREAFEQPGEAACDGFSFPRKTHFLGRWITHGGWYPQRKLRLFRRAVARIAGEQIHPEAAVPGPVRRLKGDMLHFSFPGGIMDYVERSQKYAEIAARERFAKGKRVGLAGLLLRPPMAFLQGYVLRLGFLDGVPGLAVAAGRAYHKFMRDMRLWELASKGE